MRRRGDRGSAEVLGMAVIAPAMIGLALLVMFLGRTVDARATAHGAAESAAQAAARQRSAAAAIDAAHEIGAAMLVNHTTCAAPEIDVDVADFRPGGMVAVTVSCGVDTSGLDVIAAPRDTRSTATAFATIDRFRDAGAAP